MPDADVGSGDKTEGLKKKKEKENSWLWGASIQWGHEARYKVGDCRNKQQVEQKFYWPRFSKFKAKKSSGRKLAEV